MGNIYQVVEKGIIKCMCGGMVELKSSATNLILGDAKPLYWKDLFVDSDFLVFLKRTILAKNISTSNILFNDNKVYSAHFLANSFKNNKDIDVGFKSDKALINFIGTNYYSYKNNFELAFKNELQFLYTNLIGLKLEIDKKVTEEEIYIKGVKKKLLMMSNLIIPSNMFDDDFSIIIKDKTFRNDNEIFKEEDDGRILFDLKNKDIKNDLKDEKIDLIIKTSSLEIKYKVTYTHILTTNPKSSCYLKLSLEQKDFNMDDLETKETK